MSTNYQEYEVTITFKYEAPVFEEDPKDIDELARLEHADLKTKIENNIDRFAPWPEDLEVVVKPVIK